MSQSIVVMCREGSCYGGMVLSQAVASGLTVTGVLIQDWGNSQKWHRFFFYAQRHGLFTSAFSAAMLAVDRALSARRHLPEEQTADRVAAQLGLPTFRAPTLNGQVMLSHLSGLAPDVILLGGVGVVREKVIKSAKLGVLNAHPGIVPYYRGNYVVHWTILGRDPIGVTVHLVDRGIDTGKVLSITHLELPRLRSLAALETCVDRFRARLLVAECLRFLRGQALPVEQLVISGSRPCSIMPPLSLLNTYRILWSRPESETGT